MDEELIITEDGSEITRDDVIYEHEQEPLNFIEEMADETDEDGDW